MAYITTPLSLLGQPLFVSGRVPARFAGLYQIDRLSHSNRDHRQALSTTGSISDQVVVKTGGVEAPFENGRVWLLRLADGFKAWEGWSDAAGNYTATGLELGVKYVAVGIDPFNNHKATGAGPVTAT